MWYDAAGIVLLWGVTYFMSFRRSIFFLGSNSKKRRISHDGNWCQFVRYICSESFKDPPRSTKVTRGIPKLLEYAKKHGDQIFEKYLTF